ncbi:MAG: 2-hydroxyacyl-CoA dehydratase [Firmicutes bacterium]|nr:2-hydroxyacyl-CoA dehydratase [Bacillota bacterium]
MTGYVCKYSPAELLAAFGEDTQLLNPQPENMDLADKVIHRNVCGFSRALMEERLAKEDNEALLLTRCCDSLIATADVLRKEGQKVFSLNLPHTHNGCSRDIYKDELISLANELKEYTGKNFDAAAFKAAFAPPKENFREEYYAVMGARLSDELLSFIEEHSPLPIRNNACVNTRELPYPPETDDFYELMEWYSDALLKQTPCMRMADIASRRALLEDPYLKGIIYNTVSFCDYYGFEYASLTKSTKLPILKIETDYTPQGTGQMKTRLEAFFESAAPAKGDFDMEKTQDFLYTAGIDSGSTSTNAVILDKDLKIVSFAVVPTGVKVGESAHNALEAALKKAGLSRNELGRVVTTGYGRTNLNIDGKDVTEITCHAVGAYHINPNVRTVIDIGGQDSKVIHLDENGTVADFVMNDKCAAGTGRFLDMMAVSLGLSIDEMSHEGLSYKEDLTISSMCSVFAQSEVVSLIAADKSLGDIVHGLNKSVAKKVLALGGKNKMKREYMMTGGVAKNKGVVKEIERQLGCPVLIPEEPEICGALGAAILAAKG